MIGSCIHRLGRLPILGQAWGLLGDGMARLGRVGCCLTRGAEYFITLDGEGENNRTPLLSLDNQFYVDDSLDGQLLRIMTPTDFLNEIGLDFFNGEKND